MENDSRGKENIDPILTRRPIIRRSRIPIRIQTSTARENAEQANITLGKQNINPIVARRPGMRGSRIPIRIQHSAIPRDNANAEQANITRTPAAAAHDDDSSSSSSDFDTSGSDHWPRSIRILIHRSIAIGCARRQTRNNPAVQVDVASVSERLQPSEPQVSIQEARTQFQQIVSDIIDGPVGNNTAAAAASQGEIDTLINAMQTFGNNLQQHCERELFLREYFGLPEEDRAFRVSLRQQARDIQRWEENVKTQGIMVYERVRSDVLVAPVR